MGTLGAWMLHITQTSKLGGALFLCYLGLIFTSRRGWSRDCLIQVDEVTFCKHQSQTTQRSLIPGYPTYLGTPRIWVHLKLRDLSYLATCDTWGSMTPWDPQYSFILFKLTKCVQPSESVVCAVEVLIVGIIAVPPVGSKHSQSVQNWSQSDFGLLQQSPPSHCFK